MPFPIFCLDLLINRWSACVHISQQAPIRLLALTRRRQYRVQSRIGRCRTKAESKLPAGFTDSRTSSDNAGTFKIGVGYVSICCFLEKRCRDKDTIIDIAELYGSLEHLQWFFLRRNRPLDVIVDPLP